MIQLENVSKSFHIKGGVKTVLHELSMTIPRGRSLALLGRNGAGKSTLLSMIAGALKPDTGRIIRDCKVSFPLGFSGSFHKDMTGRQNLRFVARIYGVDVEELTDYVLDFSELGPYLDQPVGVYSSGMKARLAFGVSMGIRFDTYLVVQIGQRLGRRAGKQLRQYCDCGMVLENGRVEVYDDLEDAISRHMQNMELGRVGGADGDERRQRKRRDQARVKARMKKRRGARRGLI